MKLLSTEVDERSVELVFADSDPIESAAHVLTIRVPRRGEDSDSLAFHQLDALYQARDLISEQTMRLRKIVDQIS